MSYFEKYLNVNGAMYGTSEPCFFTIESGALVYDRIDRIWRDWQSLTDKAAASGHSWQPREVGIPSLQWQLTHSVMNSQDFAPGLDDTSGLASEIVSNGETWTGATGTTPPSGWTNSVGGSPDFTINAGYIEMTGDEVLGAEMVQTLTGAPGDYYILEIAIGDGTGNAGLFLDGIGPLPLGPVSTGDQARSITKAMSFRMPDDGDAELKIVVPGGGFFTAKFIRCYMESELTGNPGTGSTGTGGPTLPTFEVLGPYMYGDTKFFIQKFMDGSECRVWFDVDSDPDPDVSVSKQEVCDSDIEDGAKAAVNAQLNANGCGPLPCASSLSSAKKPAKTAAKAAPKTKSKPKPSKEA